jgi:hypothetical protein
MTDPATTAQREHLERHGAAGRAREADLARHGAATLERVEQQRALGAGAAQEHLREHGRLSGMPEEK